MSRRCPRSTRVSGTGPGAAAEGKQQLEEATAAAAEAIQELEATKAAAASDAAELQQALGAAKARSAELEQQVAARAGLNILWVWFPRLIRGKMFLISRYTGVSRLD